MKLIEKLSKEAAEKEFGADYKNTYSGTIELAEDMFQAGFRKAREMAAEIPPQAESRYWGMEIKAAMLAMSSDILKLGEEEV